MSWSWRTKATRPSCGQEKALLDGRGELESHPKWEHPAQEVTRFMNKTMMSVRRRFSSSFEAEEVFLHCGRFSLVVEGCFSSLWKAVFLHCGKFFFTVEEGFFSLWKEVFLHCGRRFSFTVGGFPLLWKKFFFHLEGCLSSLWKVFPRCGRKFFFTVGGRFSSLWKEVFPCCGRSFSSLGRRFPLSVEGFSSDPCQSPWSWTLGQTRSCLTQLCHRLSEGR